MRVKSALALAVAVFCNYGCAKASEWLPFSDESREFSISLPAPVKTVTKDSGLPQFEASDGSVDYTVSLNQRSTLSEEKEVEVFASAFADTYQSKMKKAGYPLKRSVDKVVAGTNWKGRLYQFDKADGSSTTIQVCVEPKHNIILYAFGATLDDPKTKVFLESFVVH